LVFSAPTFSALTAVTFAVALTVLTVVFDLEAVFFAAGFLAAGFLVDLALVVAIAPPINYI
jgi:hypothetical protein